ncbi:MAG: chromate efflux transporter [Candidatus Lambdaproteobacteria bacterium]|nr:chromate efflux transporter [Candidatus Lambdaproteobacteria bacterium]
MEPQGDGANAAPERVGAGSWLEVLLVSLRLGLTSFGGPIAHLGYFRDEFVVRRKWLDELAYADLVALCQFLPGPASSQVGMGIGLARGGLPGALAAWVGFTIPSALALTAFGYGFSTYLSAIDQGWLHGLKVVAVAVVAQAVWSMARNLCPDATRVSVAVGAALGVLLWPSALGQVGVIAAGGLFGLVRLRPSGELQHVPLGIRVSRTLGAAMLGLFAVLLVGLPIAVAAMQDRTLALVDSFYRSGSLVFGGGHVVLPLLQAETVFTGWVTRDAFVAGYGAAQAVPGPLFTFAAYLGTVMSQPPNGWWGGMICLVAVFLPSFLLVIGVLPFWEHLRRLRAMQSALMGVNAAVVGLLLAALYAPVWTSAIGSPGDFGLGLVAFTLLMFWRVPPWLVVLLTAAGGAALTAGGSW